MKSSFLINCSRAVCLTVLGISLFFTVGCGDDGGDETVTPGGTGNPPSTTIAGTLSGDFVSGITLKLSGKTDASVVSSSSGTFSFGDVPDGTYVLSPEMAGFTFDPLSITLAVAGAPISDLTFDITRVPNTYIISGTAASGATVKLAGTATREQVAAEDGSYSFGGLADGSYIITPISEGYTFEPETLSVKIVDGDMDKQDFVATSIPPVAGFYCIRGTIISGATVVLSGKASGTQTSLDGSYSFDDLEPGDYMVKPTHPGFTFEPETRSVKVIAGDVDVDDFTATPIPGTYSISGTAPVGTEVSLTGLAEAVQVVEPDGNFKFAGLFNGEYLITPTLTGFGFTPEETVVEISDEDQMGIAFTANPAELSITELEIVMKPIPAGEFMMGSPDNETDREDNEGPQHLVKLTKPFWAAETEVTIAQFRAFLRETGNTYGVNFSSGYCPLNDDVELTLADSEFGRHDNQPMVTIDWYAASNFCRWLTLKQADKLPEGYEYRLPTEAEWEYACRAGTTTRFHFGDDPEYTLLDEYCWSSGGFYGHTHIVGGKEPNDFGLYDMHGNVWEFCRDWYGDYESEDTNDPTGPESGDSRIWRGGGWATGAPYCRVANRTDHRANVADYHLGFRVFLAPKIQDGTSYLVGVTTEGTASEDGSSASFIISLSAPVSVETTVNFTFCGTATVGDDFPNMRTSITIPVGAAEARVVIEPFNDDLKEGDEVVILTIEEGTGYTAARPRVAGITILDNDGFGDAVVNIEDLDLILRKIPAGTFVMGSPYVDEGPQHEVTISQHFWAGETEITQDQFVAIMGIDSIPSFTNGRLPIRSLANEAAVEFCRALTTREADSIPAGYEYRLPTEAEWEYMCRAGSPERYFFGDDPTYHLLEYYAWYDGNSGYQRHPVAELLPNDFGLYDIYGNLAEHCLDGKRAYSEEPVVDPIGKGQTLRGDDYKEEWGCRSAKRYSVGATGFRIVLGQKIGPNGVDWYIEMPDMQLKKIPAGTFKMGSLEGELGSNDNELPQHDVALTRDFWLGESEVTIQQFREYLLDERNLSGVDLVHSFRPLINDESFNLSGTSTGTDLLQPMVEISWRAAQNFCAWLSQRYADGLPSGYTYRLPTEAEWEYACRADSDTSFCYGNDSGQLGNYAWYSDNSDNRSHKVKQKTPNIWGLFDMHGNVSEWCYDRYSDFSEGSQIDPLGSPVGGYQLYRKGAWSSPSGDCRSTSRMKAGPNLTAGNVGFRVALAPILPSIFEISGTISGDAIANVTVRLRGTSELTTKTDGSGNYSFADLAPGQYEVTPIASGAGFAPLCRRVQLIEQDVMNQDFSATSGTYGATGRITGTVLGDVSIDVTGNADITIVTDAYGYFFLESMTPGEYVLTPSKPGIVFAPPILSLKISDSDTHNFDFTGTEGDDKTIADLGMTLKAIPAGTFTMGSPGSENGRQVDEGPQHQVRISRSYWMSETEVTQAQYALLNGHNPSHFFGDLSRPVDMVSWEDAANFCRRLTEHRRDTIPDGYEYRLPTEAEWEYACRVGSTTNFSYGQDDTYADLDKYAWLSGYTGESAPVKSRRPNDWGLYDMYGNVKEWTNSWHGEYPTFSVVDPLGSIAGTRYFRAARGGSRISNGAGCRSASRGPTTPGVVGDDVGFRVVLAPTLPQTYVIQGNIEESYGIGVSIFQDGQKLASSSSNIWGDYYFYGVPAGTYEIRPEGDTRTFRPAEIRVVVDVDDIINVDFESSSLP